MASTTNIKNGGVQALNDEGVKREFEGNEKIPENYGKNGNLPAVEDEHNHPNDKYWLGWEKGQTIFLMPWSH
jgi:hypothetical protein